MTDLLDALPDTHRPTAERMRSIIHAAAKATNTDPLEETLKWNQPAFLPARKAGTTIRLGMMSAYPNHLALFVHCQTTLIGSYQTRFPNEFQYLDNRAVLIPTDQPLNEAALHQIAAMALTYHRDKKSPR